MNEDVKQSIKELLAEKNDNSLYINNFDKLKDSIPQMTQMFEINPPSFC